MSQLSIKTRIETRTCKGWGSLEKLVWVSYPLKQGLKQRIINELPERLNFCLSQLSIKTRIETKAVDRNLPQIPGVWVSYPLKQGLKLFVKSISVGIQNVWVSYPLKQGLKPTLDIASMYFLWSLSQLSIKTRIETRKPCYGPGLGSSVWVSYPLKQGLKHILVDQGKNNEKSLSQLSIKTRIETATLICYARFRAGLSQLSIKTRIETPKSNQGIRWCREFESAIH